MRKIPRNHWRRAPWLVFGKVAGEGASQETGPRRPNPLAFRGERRSLHACFRIIPHLSVAQTAHFCFHRHSSSALPRISAQAASIRGVVTDASGAKVTGANVVLFSNGKVVASAVSTADGSFQILTGIEGRFFLVVSAKSFRQLETPGFYAGRLDSIERNMVLEPEWVRESIVVTATGTPTPQPQTSAATTVLGPLDLALRDDLVSALRLMPGTVVVQNGQLGAQTSLFVRGGDSDANKILLDGVDAGDLGGQIRLWPALDHGRRERRGLSRPRFEPLWRRRGQRRGQPDHAARHHQLSFASLSGRCGQLQHLARGSSRWPARTTSSITWALSVGCKPPTICPMDEYHVATTAANIGWQPNGNTQIRGTLHYGVDAHRCSQCMGFLSRCRRRHGKRSGHFCSARSTTRPRPSFHNTVRYGLTRKREQYSLWQASGNYERVYRLLLSARTASAIRSPSPAPTATRPPDRRCSTCASTYPNQYQNVSNRDQVVYQGDYHDHAAS